MIHLWATMLPAAIVMALSPTGIIEMILVVFSARPRLNAGVFLASVMVGVFLLPLLGASILRATVARDAGTTNPSVLKAWVLVVLGVLLALFAVGSFLRRADTTPSPVFDKIASMGPGAVFVLSLTVVWFNPINALVLLSVGSDAATVDMSIATLLLPLTVFTVLATLPFIAVVVLLAWGEERARPTLERAEQWLVKHSRTTVAAVLGFLGLLLLAQGVASLVG